MQNLTVKVNPSRRTCSIAQTIYLGGKYDVTYEPDGIYQMRIVAPSSDSPSEGIVVWAETDGTGKKLELNRRVLFNEFKRQEARQPGMTIAAKVYILDASVVGGDYASGGEPIADGDITIEYVPCTDIIDPAVYESARQMLDTAWGYKNEAKGFRDEAEGFRDEAEQNKNNAKESADDAKQYAENAANQVTAAKAEVEAAENARAEAQAAKELARQSASDASTAAYNAEFYANEIKLNRDQIKKNTEDIAKETGDRAAADQEIWDALNELSPGSVRFCLTYEDITSIVGKKANVLYVDCANNIIYRYDSTIDGDGLIPVSGAGGGVEVYEWMDQLPAQGKVDVIYCVTEGDDYLTQLFRWNDDDKAYVAITMSAAQINSQINEHISEMIQVVPPSDDGAGKAADAKAVYEELEGKLNKYSYITHSLIGEPNEGLHLTPYTCTQVVFGEGHAFTVLGVLGGNSEFLRDLQMVVDCRNGIAPTITWLENFHPRTDAETDLACVAGVRNVYWISEYAEGEFCVAGWQETDGGGTSGGAA